MTYEEAKNWLGKQPHYFFTFEEAKLDQECREVINEALEKQIPKKPIVEPYFYGKYYRCPTCGIMVEKNKCCSNNDCRQCIDWSK